MVRYTRRARQAHPIHTAISLHIVCGAINAAGAAVGAIVNVPIGDVLRAIDPATPVGRRDTIADVAGRGDPDFESRLQDQVAGLSTKAADVVRGVAAAAPALQRSLAEAMRNLDAALGGLDR